MYDDKNDFRLKYRCCFTCQDGKEQQPHAPSSSSILRVRHIYDVNFTRKCIQHAHNNYLPTDIQTYGEEKEVKSCTRFLSYGPRSGYQALLTFNRRIWYSVQIFGEDMPLTSMGYNVCNRHVEQSFNGGLQNFV